MDWNAVWEIVKGLLANNWEGYVVTFILGLVIPLNVLVANMIRSIDRLPAPVAKIIKSILDKLAKEVDKQIEDDVPKVDAVK